VLAGAVLDRDAVLGVQVGSTQHILPIVEVVGQVVEPAARASGILSKGQVVRLAGHAQPRAGLAAVVHHDMLRQPKTELLLKR
jgi:hypothetical protein